VGYNTNVALTCLENSIEQNKVKEKRRREKEKRREQRE